MNVLSNTSLIDKPEIFHVSLPGICFLSLWDDHLRHVEVLKLLVRHIGSKGRGGEILIYDG